LRNALAGGHPGLTLRHSLAGLALTGRHPGLTLRHPLTRLARLALTGRHSRPTLWHSLPRLARLTWTGWHPGLTLRHSLTRLARARHPLTGLACPALGHALTGRHPGLTLRHSARWHPTLRHPLLPLRRLDRSTGVLRRRNLDLAVTGRPRRRSAQQILQNLAEAALAPEKSAEQSPESAVARHVASTDVPGRQASPATPG
jgi:hypothetical protein